MKSPEVATVTLKALSVICDTLRLPQTYVMYHCPFCPLFSVPFTAAASTGSLRASPGHLPGPPPFVAPMPSHLLPFLSPFLCYSSLALFSSIFP